MKKNDKLSPVLSVDEKETNQRKKEKTYWFDYGCYKTQTVKWILAQEKGASIFVFYQRLFELAVNLEKEELSFHEIIVGFQDVPSFSPEFMEYAISNLVKVGVVNVIGRKINGAEVMYVHLPDNDIMFRNV